MLNGTPFLWKKSFNVATLQGFNVSKLHDLTELRFYFETLKLWNLPFSGLPFMALRTLDCPVPADRNRARTCSCVPRPDRTQPGQRFPGLSVSEQR